MDSVAQSGYSSRRPDRTSVGIRGVVAPALHQAPVAQLDRVLPSEGRGRAFESRRARQIQGRAGSSRSGPFCFSAVVFRLRLGCFAWLVLHSTSIQAVILTRPVGFSRPPAASRRGKTKVSMKSTLLASALVLASATPLSAAAADPAPGEFAFGGDARMGYFSREREDRNGSRSDESDWRIRIRPGVLWQVTTELSARARFAGRYSTDDSNDNHFEFFTAIPQSDGLGFGDSTIDELYLRYKPGNWDVKVGRMQTSFELEGIAKKSLSRNDSPNTDITWTDGIHARSRRRSRLELPRHPAAQRGRRPHHRAAQSAGVHRVGQPRHVLFRHGKEGRERSLPAARLGCHLHTECAAHGWHRGRPHRRLSGGHHRASGAAVGPRGRNALRVGRRGRLRALHTDREGAAPVGFRRCEGAGFPDFGQSGRFHAGSRRRVWSTVRRAEAGCFRPISATTRNWWNCATSGSCPPRSRSRRACASDAIWSSEPMPRRSAWMTTSTSGSHSASDSAGFEGESRIPSSCPAGCTAAR
jgi:hypothetical protein